MEEDKIIDQSELANDVSNKIEYEFIDMFLVKPLDVVKVKKEFTKPVSDKPVKDENGIEAIDYETEVKEVDSDFRKGVILKIPISYTSQLSEERFGNLAKISVGDIVVFRDRAGINFDLLKDSKLIRYYDIYAVVK